MAMLQTHCHWVDRQRSHPLRSTSHTPAEGELCLFDLATRFVMLEVRPESIPSMQLMSMEQLAWLLEEVRDRADYQLLVLMLGQAWICVRIVSVSVSLSVTLIVRLC